MVRGSWLCLEMYKFCSVQVFCRHFFSCQPSFDSHLLPRMDMGWLWMFRGPIALQLLCAAAVSSLHRQSYPWNRSRAAGSLREPQQIKYPCWGWSERKSFAWFLSLLIFPSSPTHRKQTFGAKICEVLLTPYFRVPDFLPVAGFPTLSGKTKMQILLFGNSPEVRNSGTREIFF